MSKCDGVLAGPPERVAAVPSVVLELADGRAVRAVWVNRHSGVTFAVGTDAARCWSIGR